jgi:hypothetical protein
MHLIAGAIMMPIGLVASVALSMVALILIVVWPEIKTRSWVLKLPKSPHEKLEEKVDDTKSALVKSLQEINKIRDLFGGQIQQLGQDRTKAIEERAKIGSQISKLEYDLKVITKAIDDLGQGFVGTMLFLDDITILIMEADQSLEALRQMARLCPGSGAALRPFSRPWWACDASEEPPLVIQWAAFQKNHIEHCKFFAGLFQIPESDVIYAGLREYLTWNSQDGTDYCASQLLSQKNTLFILRQNRAVQVSAMLRQAAAKSVV